MSVRAKVYNPKISVKVLKNVARTTTDGGQPVSERFKGANRVIELSPWLSESSGVRLSKSTREPAGGFSITLADRIHPDDLDSLYGLLEPMDLVEIRMAHEPHKVSNPGELPIVMRGFISDVTRSEGIGNNGAPQRHVVISGA